MYKNCDNSERSEVAYSATYVAWWNCILSKKLCTSTSVILQDSFALYFGICTVFNIIVWSVISNILCDNHIITSLFQVNKYLSKWW